MNSSITWTTPSDWQKRPPKGMRTGSFFVKGVNDEEVDISIIFLAGESGDDLSNINRWREQISLSPWGMEDLLNQQVILNIPLGISKVVDFCNKDDERIVSAIIPVQNGTWFVKMLGEKNLIEEQKPVFLSFLETISSLSR